MVVQRLRSGSCFFLLRAQGVDSANSLGGWRVDNVCRLIHDSLEHTRCLGEENLARLQVGQLGKMLDTLKDGEKMLLLLFREPHPLYKVLRQNGHDYETELLPDGTFEILITR